MTTTAKQSRKLVSQGYTAHGNFKKCDDNPHAANSYERHLWNKGWQLACKQHCKGSHEVKTTIKQVMLGGFVLATLILATVVVATIHLWG